MSNAPSNLPGGQAPVQERRAFTYVPINSVPSRTPSDANFRALSASESRRHSPVQEHSPGVDLQQLNADDFRHAYPAPYSPRPSLFNKSGGKAKSYFTLRSPLSSGAVTPAAEELEEDLHKGRVKKELDGGGRPAFGRTRHASLLTGVSPYRLHEAEATPISHNIPFEPRRPSLLQELLTSILIPLPFLLGSLVRPSTPAIDHSTHSPGTEAIEELVEEIASTALPVTTRNSSLFEAFALASGTLLLVGLLGQLQRQLVESQERPRPSGITFKPPTADGSSATHTSIYSQIKKVLARTAAVCLPFLATAELGGVRTGLFLLAACAEGLVAPDNRLSIPAGSKWRKVYHSHRYIAVVFVGSVLVDLFVVPTDNGPASVVRGYAALVKSIMLLRSPLPVAPPLQPHKALSPLVASVAEARTTALAGLSLMATTVAVAYSLSALPSFDVRSTLLYVFTLLAASALMLLAAPTLLRSTGKFGLLLGLAGCVGFALKFDTLSHVQIASIVGLGLASYAGVWLDTRSWARPVTSSDSRRHQHHARHDHAAIDASGFTKFLLGHTEDFPLLHSILLERDSRRIAYFMVINLTFMFVQTFYSVVSGSLGLLSDSIHMLFDCVGLLVGLVAAVMSKWPPNTRFPYGYGKVEVLSGLGNGIFLMLISVEIIWESFERVLEGAELKRMNELLLVSIAGLLVNLIGLAFTGGHHHHGHSHGHSHGHADHNSIVANGGGEKAHANGMLHDEKIAKSTPLKQHHGHHHHGHSNENMAGIYLHILADTMGSVAVIVSTLLTKYTNWFGWDPIASTVIAILIILASYPLVVGSARQLLLTLPEEVEYTLRDTLQSISALPGVAGYAVPRFWLDERHVEVTHTQDESWRVPSYDDKALSLHHPDALTHLPPAHSDEHGHEHHHHHHDHPPPQSNDSAPDSPFGDPHEDQPPWKTNESSPASHNHSHTHLASHSHSHADHNAHSLSHDHSHSHDDCSSPKLLGVIHIIAARGAGLDDVRSQVEAFLKDRHMDVLVHVERGTASSCWCRIAPSRGHARTQSTVPM